MSATLTECPICYERFNKSNKQPKILRCGHTFCKDCLIKQKQKSNNLECCICREIQNVNEPEEITTNRTIYDLLYDPLRLTTENSFNNDLINEKEKIEFRIIMLGPPNSGKTSIVRRYTDRFFSDKYDITIGFDFKVKEFKYGNKNIKLQIFDTAGTEIYQSITRNYYKSSFGAIVVFDITSKEYFESVKYYIDNYRENRDNDKEELIYLIGNKIDLENRKISEKDVQDFMNKNNLTNYKEVSAKTGENIDNLFNLIIEDIKELYLRNNKYKNYIKKIKLVKKPENEKCCC